MLPLLIFPILGAFLRIWWGQVYHLLHKHSPIRIYSHVSCKVKIMLEQVQETQDVAFSGNMEVNCPVTAHGTDSK